MKRAIDVAKHWQKEITLKPILLLVFPTRELDMQWAIATKKIPHQRPYSKYTPTWPRSFMPQSQQMRDLVAKMKLIPNSSLIKDKRGIFLDDSIVRGTQLKDNVRDLHKAGIKEVHMRIACPPLTYPCEFLNFSRSRSNLDLATHTAVKQLEGKENVDMKEYSDTGNGKYAAMVDKIRENLDLTTLKFQKLDDLVKAIGLPKEKLCTHCWDGSQLFLMISMYKLLKDLDSSRFFYYINTIPFFKLW
ncbi:MAG: hypothetical protein MZV63_19170 [Marinilabiliales bacterium]|nr:hypothetical protein [Marinilabiliales bacterium]